MPPIRLLVVFHTIAGLVIVLLSQTCVPQTLEGPQTLSDGNLQIGQCSVISTDRLKAYGRTQTYSNGIPRIIHYVNTGNYIAIQYSPLVKQCMEVNNDATFVLWNDFAAYRFMIELQQKYIRLYSTYFAKFAICLKRSDAFRYFVLLEFGGVYMDLDTKCQMPFRSVFVNGSCVLSKDVEEQTRILYNLEFLAMNSLMACVPAHRFFGHLVDRLTRADGSDILAQTGPIFLTNILREYHSLWANESAPDRLISVTVADSYMFSPHTEGFLEAICSKNQSLFWKRKGCTDLAEHRRRQRTAYGDAVVVHQFTHLGYDAQKPSSLIRDHICLKFAQIHVVWT